MVANKKEDSAVPGEAIGTVAAQSIGEPSTQMMLRVFHSAGVSSVIQTRGLPRMIELADARKRPKSPVMRIYIEDSIKNKYEKVREIWRKLEEVKVSSLISGYTEDFRAGTMVLHANREKLSFYELTMKDIRSSIEKVGGVEVDIEGDEITVKASKKAGIKAIRTVFVHLLNGRVSGVQGINKAVIQQEDDGSFTIATSGSNILGVMNIEGVDKEHIYCNDPFEVARAYGIEAARNVIANEMITTINEEGLTVGFRHVALVADMMTLTGAIKSIGRHGVAGEKSSVLAKAAYEETVKHLVNASIFGESDPLNGVAENILIGKQVTVGTGYVKLIVKKEDIKKLKEK
ncbi:MAG: DNA-directed RNA polymerase subunit A'' [Candidatus Micrarchaeia archaeon]